MVDRYKAQKKILITSKKKKIDKSMAFSVWLTFHIFILIIIGLFIHVLCTLDERNKETYAHVRALCQCACEKRQ